jgi:predicted HAD superfamily hydrolase
MKNWIYYMQEGIKSMWKKKEVKKYKSITEEITFNSEGVVHKNHPFKNREFDGAFKECGCLPDCGCKE